MTSMGGVTGPLAATPGSHSSTIPTGTHLHTKARKCACIKIGGECALAGAPMHMRVRASTACSGVSAWQGCDSDWCGCSHADGYRVGPPPPMTSQECLAVPQAKKSEHASASTSVAVSGGSRCVWRYSCGYWTCGSCGSRSHVRVLRTLMEPCEVLVFLGLRSAIWLGSASGLPHEGQEALLGPHRQPAPPSTRCSYRRHLVEGDAVLWRALVWCGWVWVWVWVSVGGGSVCKPL
jgi:hypothetical protein